METKILIECSKEELIELIENAVSNSLQVNGFNVKEKHTLHPDRHLDELPISVRLYWAILGHREWLELERGKVPSLRDVYKCDQKRIKKCKNLGSKSYEELRGLYKASGLS